MRFFVLRVLALVLFALSLSSFTLIVGQDRRSGEPTFRAKESRSLLGVKTGDEFVSKEARFSILLPKESLTSFDPFDVGKPQSGGTFAWEVTEGSFALQFFDKPDAASFTAAQRQQMLTDGLAAALANAGGTRISEEPANLGAVAGRKIKLVSGGQILLGRAYSDRTRLYMLVAQPNSSRPGSEHLVTKALDSFKIVDDRAQVD